MNLEGRQKNLRKGKKGEKNEKELPILQNNN